MTLLELASRIQDLYYQDYAPGDRFLDIEDFKFQVAAKYSEMLNVMYKQVRAENRAQDGFSNIELSAAWLIEETVEIAFNEEQDRFTTTTKFPIFSFDFDGSSNALQGVHSFGPNHKVFRKIMLNERRFKQVLPVTNKILFYVNDSSTIVFWEGNVKKGDKVRVQYIPDVSSLQDDCLLSANMSSEITKEVLNIMVGARNGTIIQKVDDQNRNLTPGNQTNQTLNK